MDESGGPRNRRERRAAERKSQPKDAAGIPLVKPDFDAKPTGKTLYQIAEERKALLDKGQPFSNSSNSDDTQEIHGDDGDDYQHLMADEPVVGAFANAVIYTTSLSMLHVTLDVLVLSQYRQEVVWTEVGRRIARMTPALFLVVWLFHTEQVNKYSRLRQLFFLGLSVAAGCYLIYAGNEFGYYFVMKRAPPTGTLWIWSVVEMDLLWSLVHVLLVGGYMLWGGYRPF